LRRGGSCNGRVDDHCTIHEFSDAVLTAMLRKRIGVVEESDEDRPEGAALN
jgi:hypothetical protein